MRLRDEIAREMALTRPGMGKVEEIDYVRADIAMKHRTELAEKDERRFGQLLDTIDELEGELKARGEG